MNDSSKIKLLTGTTVLLLVLNIVVMGFMWFGHHHTHPEGRYQGPDRGEVIIRELKLNDDQRSQFEDLREEHHHIIRTTDERDRHTHEAMFDLIKSGQDNTKVADSLINEIANDKKQIETATYHHLAKLRKICTPEQQKTFDDIIINLFKQGPQGPPASRP